MGVGVGARAGRGGTEGDQRCSSHFMPWRGAHTRAVGLGHVAASAKSPPNTPAAGATVVAPACLTCWRHFVSPQTDIANASVVGLKGLQYYDNAAGALATDAAEAVTFSGEVGRASRVDGQLMGENASLCGRGTPSTPSTAGLSARMAPSPTHPRRTHTHTNHPKPPSPTPQPRWTAPISQRQTRSRLPTAGAARC